MTAILAVVGPTASGKTALALDLAERLETEIISADSMQVYRGMAIGTGAPTEEEQRRVRHHFVGFLDPGTVFSAGDFQREARPVVSELNARNKVAVVAGGSGLYVDALINGLFEGPGRDEPFREALRREAVERGVPALYDRLRQVDPDYAARIYPADLRRIERALEVFELTGEPFSRLHRRHREQYPPLSAIQIALDRPRAELYARIDARAESMIADGFLDEVRRLLDDGREADIMRIRSLGYREMVAYLKGEQSFELALSLMQRNTRRFAKRQLTWFRNNPALHWFPVESGRTVDGLADRVMGLLDAMASADRPQPQ